MKHTFVHLFRPRFATLGFAALTAACLSLPSAGHAACFAEYKAKRDNPLKLHYGVAQLSDSACTKAKAKAALSPRLAKDNWVLLSIVGFIAQDKLNGVKANAGDYFLRY